MKTITRVFFWFVLPAAGIPAACNDHDAKPLVPQLRAEKMTYDFDGGRNYRDLVYDAHGKLSAIISGVVYPGGDPIETSFEFRYEDNVLKEIYTDEDQQWTFAYRADGLLDETNLYLEGELIDTHQYTYDAHGRLTEEITYSRATEDESLGPVAKQEREYNNDHNLIRVRHFGHDGEDFVQVSTVEYEDFDTRKNSEHLFANNFYHPFARFFHNSPRTIRVINSQGTITERRFTYAYNAHGLMIRKTAEDDGIEIKFEFSEIK